MQPAPLDFLKLGVKCFLFQVIAKMFIRFQGKCILVQFFIYPSMRVNSMVPNRLVQQTAHLKAIKKLKLTYTCGVYK